MSELISPNEIIEIASARGYRITREKLARWRRYGLLTTVKRRFPGSGSETCFLRSETNRAIEIAALLEQKSNSLDWVGWQLWLRGYPMPKALWGSHLQKAFKWVEKVGKLAGSITNRSDAWWEKIVGEVWNAESTPSRLHNSRKSVPSGFRNSRKAVGQSAFSSYLTTILQIAGGDYWGFSPHGNDEQDRKDILGLDRGLGLRSAREHHIPGEQPWLDGGICLELRQVSEAIGRHGNAGFVKGLSDHELQEARIEFWLLRETVLNKHQWQTRQFCDENAFGFRMLVKILRHETIKMDAALLALWIIARTNSKLRSNTQRWLAENAVFNNPAFLQSDNLPRKLKRKTSVFPYTTP